MSFRPERLAERYDSGIKEKKSFAAGYKIGIDLSAFIFVALVMLPNLIWFGNPAENDVLNIVSKTRTLDYVTSLVQIAMIVTLFLVINLEGKRAWNKLLFVGVFGSLVVYYILWFMYYQGIVNTVTLMLMCLMPCCGFICFALQRRNLVALVMSGLFTVGHTIYAVINFVL